MKLLSFFFKEEAGDDTENIQLIFFAALLLFLALFFVIESVIEHYKPRVGHTTGIVVLLGILVSYMLYHIAAKKEERVLMRDL
jgi:hypothetical protein